MDEEKLVKISIMLALTAGLGLISWVIAWFFGFVWFWWFLILIFIVSYKVFD